MHQIHLRIKFREKPTAAEGNGSYGGREKGGGGETPIGGSVMPLPAFGAPGSLAVLLSTDVPKITGLKVSTW